jgi:hypothetical protein
MGDIRVALQSALAKSVRVVESTANAEFFVGF